MLIISILLTLFSRYLLHGGFNIDFVTKIVGQVLSWSQKTLCHKFIISSILIIRYDNRPKYKQNKSMSCHLPVARKKGKTDNKLKIIDYCFILRQI